MPSIAHYSRDRLYPAVEKFEDFPEYWAIALNNRECWKNTFLKINIYRG